MASLKIRIQKMRSKREFKKMSPEERMEFRIQARKILAQAEENLRAVEAAQKRLQAMSDDAP